MYTTFFAIVAAFLVEGKVNLTVELSANVLPEGSGLKLKCWVSGLGGGLFVNWVKYLRTDDNTNTLERYTIGTNAELSNVFADDGRYAASYASNVGEDTDLLTLNISGNIILTLHFSRNSPTIGNILLFDIMTEVFIFFFHIITQKHKTIIEV